LFNSAGSDAITGCESCIDTANVTLASEVEELAQECKTILPSSTAQSARAPTAVTLSTTSKTGTATTAGVTFNTPTSLAHNGVDDVFGHTLKASYFQLVMVLALVAGLFSFL
jgi:hypothetical protein